MVISAHLTMLISGYNILLLCYYDIIRMICNHKVAALTQSKEDKLIVLNIIRDKWNRMIGNQ